MKRPAFSDVVRNVSHCSTAGVRCRGVVAVFLQLSHTHNRHETRNASDERWELAHQTPLMLHTVWGGINFFAGVCYRGGADEKTP